MAISFSRFVDITSGVGAGAGVRARDLIGRIFSTNPLIPTGSVVEFESADAVLTYFGSDSDEYAIAAFYFGWISKNIKKAQKIGFASWADVAVAPRIFGKVQTQALGSFTSITAGTFSLTLGADTETVGPINFGAAASLAAVAALIQTAVHSAGSGALWTSATVVWNSTRGSFDFTGGATGDNVISVSAGTGGSDVAGQLGWLTGAIVSDGSAAQTVTEVLSESTETSNNFASFSFIPTLDLSEKTEAAEWNDTQNNMFIYCVPVTAANAAATSAALIDLSGVSLTLSPLATEYPELVPMIILAATDYAARNSAVNFMFTQFTLTPSVSTDSDANTYDALRVNYYGSTQTAGQVLDFYQRGTLCGLSTDAVDQNVYANEIWLKDKAGSSIMSLLIALPKVSANSAGKIQLQGVLQGVVDQGLFNGVVSVGKPLSMNQKLYIGQITGDDLAWHQVQNNGYWYGVTFESYVTTDGRTEWKAVYTLCYSKDDAIRKVDGTHVLI